MIFGKILKKPHPFIFNYTSVIISSLVTFIVLFVFRPFEFRSFPTPELITWSIVFTLFVGTAVLIVGLAVKKFLSNAIESWTVGREMTLVIVVLTIIMLLIFALFCALNPQADLGELFSLVVIRTLGISVFPILILVLFEQYYHQKSKREEAEKLNQKLMEKQVVLHEHSSAIAQSTKIKLVSENQKVALQVAEQDVYFVKSEGNYVEVFYLQDQNIQKELIRNSLKAIEEQLSTTHFFRCHKSYLINLNYIQKVVGNARNLELLLDKVEGNIPVSRTKSKMLLALFQQQAQ